MLLEQLSKLTRPVIIMPFHLNSALLSHAAARAGARVLGFYDNDRSLEGKRYNGLTIKRPVPASGEAQDAEVIIFYKKYEDDIRRQLEKLGYTRFISARELDKKELEAHFGELDEGEFLSLSSKYSRRLWVNGSKQIFMEGIPAKDYGRVVFSALDGGNAGKRGRRILMIPHALTYVGSTIALLLAANALKRNGDEPVFFCRESDSLLPELLNDGIPVIIDGLWPGSERIIALAEEFDLVIVNTALASNGRAIEKLNKLQTPVLWWFHEAHLLYENGWIKTLSPDLGEHIHIYCAGEYARDAFLRANPKARTKTLWWGIKDYYKDSPREEPAREAGGRLKIMTIGTIQLRKGQDIFCEAIRGLEEPVRAGCEFIFIGIPFEDNPAYESILSLKKDYPQSITLIGRLSREDIYEAIRECDCMVCASRDEPGPIFIAEAMMLGKVCICSENTGLAAFIRDGCNGFIYENNDAGLLREKMRYVISNYGALQELKRRGRETYETYFSFEVFSENFLNEVNSLTGKGERA